MPLTPLLEPPARLVLFACAVALWADGQLDASVEASGSWAVGDVPIVIDYLPTSTTSDARDRSFLEPTTTTLCAIFHLFGLLSSFILCSLSTTFLMYTKYMILSIVFDPKSEQFAESY